MLINLLIIYPLFPPDRRHIDRHNVAACIRRVRDGFLRETSLSDRAKTITSHSGRRHCITVMVLKGIDDDVGMVFSGHTRRSQYRAYADVPVPSLKDDEKLRAASVFF